MVMADPGPAQAWPFDSPSMILGPIIMLWCWIELTALHDEPRVTKTCFLLLHLLYNVYVEGGWDVREFEEKVSYFIFVYIYRVFGRVEKIVAHVCVISSPLITIFIWHFFDRLARVEPPATSFTVFATLEETMSGLIGIIHPLNTGRKRWLLCLALLMNWQTMTWS